MAGARRAVHDAYRAHGLGDGTGGLQRCPGNTKVIFVDERSVCRAVSALRELGDAVGHYACDDGDHWHITNLTGTTARQRKRWRQRRGRFWVKGRPRRATREGGRS